MYVSDLFEKVYQPQPWNPAGITPALMTFNEYYKLANSKGKFHSSDAYDSTEGFKHKKIEDYPTQIRRVKINGITFDIRLKQETRAGRYTKLDDKFNVIGADEYSEDDFIKQGKQPHTFMIAVFDGATCCACAQDEWGGVFCSGYHRNIAASVSGRSSASWHGPMSRAKHLGDLPHKDMRTSLKSIAKWCAMH